MIAPASPPCIAIVLALEAAPRVYIDATSEGQESRLLDWVHAHDELAALVTRALELAEEQRAA